MKSKGESSSTLGQTRGQVTIFIIIAVVIVALVGIYVAFSQGLINRGLPTSFEPAYASLVNCLQEETETGINILESQGGYIELPAFESGSSYMPFSSQLSLAGNPIPYWFYVSGNGIPREQVPSKADMEEQLAIFVSERIRDCNLREYHDEGFLISIGEPEASASIENREVRINLEMSLTMERGNETAVLSRHKTAVDSRLGELYDAARAVYEEEQDKLFLEQRGVDILRNYAPVDGAEISCAPLTWSADQVFNNIQEGIDANMAALKNRGAEEDYFALNLPVKDNVRFITSRNWPNAFEVLPGDNSQMIAMPVGNQPGLGILGFCYVAYHYVYNVKYPVLIQVGSAGEEVFQFPVAVVIQGNLPREPTNTTAFGDLAPELCKHKNTEIQIKTYDTSFRPVESQVSYECFGNVCSIGQTEVGTLKEDFPQCANGYVIARAEGFKETRYLFSTIQSGSLDVIMDRVYPTGVELLVDGKAYTGEAMVTISSDYTSQTLFYPWQDVVELGEGMHEIQVQIFKNSTIHLGATTKEQCVQVPNGVLGIFGLTKDKCFEIQVPEQTISRALAGGGNQEKYILETDLARGKTLQIDSASLPTPTSVDQVSNNYLVFEQSGLEVEMI